MQALVTNVGELVVGIVWEPADWAIALSDGLQWSDAVGFLPIIPAAFGDNLARGVSRIIPAGWSDEAGHAMGHWVSFNSSAPWARYQSYVTGVEGAEFMFNGVKFDGVVGALDGTSGQLNDLKLLDSKYWSEDFVASMISGRNPGAYQSKIQQAYDQIRAANGTRIEWHFHNESAAALWERALIQEGIHEIKIVYTPWIQ